MSVRASTSNQCCGPKACLFYFQDGSFTSYAEVIRTKLRCFQVHTMDYTWPRFQAQNAVYMKVAVDWRHFSSVEQYRQPSTFMYIGSTSQSVFRRGSNRLSVAKKLSSGGEAQAELAIRHWVSNDCLQDYNLFLLAPCSSYREAWITEHCLIGMLQPKLNHPYIVSFLKRSALGFRPNQRIRNTVSSKFGLRLWRKLRKKPHKQLQPEPFQLKRRSAWEILFNLACFSRAPFEEAKRLRSDRYLPGEIYSLIRLSNCLEEPGKSKARKILKSVRRMLVQKHVVAQISIGTSTSIYFQSRFLFGCVCMGQEPDPQIQTYIGPVSSSSFQDQRRTTSDLKRLPS